MRRVKYPARRVEHPPYPGTRFRKSPDDRDALRYVSASPMKHLRLLLVLLCAAAPLRAQIVISEFLASNSNSIVDENGDNEDWIEISNSSGSPVNLLGWYLTDDVNQPRKWAFPSMTLNGGAFRVVFASNKNRANPAANLHTNFKLSASPGYLALTQDIAGGGVQVVQAFNLYPKQVTDISYGLSYATTSLVTASSAAKALVPTVGNGGSALGATWRGAGEPFADGAWQNGTPGVGVAGAATVVGAANLKLRLEASSLANIVTDTSGAAHNGTNVGASTAWLASSTDTAAAPLMRRGAMQFASTLSTSSQVAIPAHADFNSVTGTIMFWMKSAGTAGTVGGGSEGAMLFDRRSPNTTGNVLVLYADGRLFSQPGGGGSFFSTVTVNDNQWHHVSFTFNRAVGGTDAFYVDGVARGSGVHGNAWLWPTTVQIELGRSHDAYWFKYNGLMDEVRFYNAPLSAAQIAQIASGADENVDASDVGLSLAGTLPGNAGAFIRIPFTVANPTTYQTLRLTTRVNDGFTAYVNGTQIDALNAPGSPAYDSVATVIANPGRIRTTDVPVTGGTLSAGTNILAIHGMNNSTSDANFLVQPTLDGLALDPNGNYLLTKTPGAVNSGIRTNIGPIVSGATKNPNPRPTGTAASPPLTINATVVPSLRPLSTSNPVQLKYAIMYGAETSVTMTLTATPNVYTAQIPTSTLGAGQMLRWRVVASDNTAITGTAPEYLDPIDNEQFYGTVAVDSTIETSLPVIYWFTPLSTAADNATGTRNSFFFKAPGDLGVGRFYDNVEINLHGQSSSGFAKKSYDLDFNEDNRFEWNIAGKRVKDINLLTNWGDKSKTHNQMTHEAIATVGGVHHWCYQVRVQQVTPVNAATPATHFWSIADMMEDGDEDFMERNGRDPNGALYKIYDNLAGSGNAEKKTRLFEGKTDLDALITGLNPASALAARRLYAYDNLDLPQCVSYFVGLAITSSQDHGHKNYYVYRDSVGTREWSILPWDVDLTWGRNWLDAQGYFTDTMFTNNDLDMYNGAQQGKGENRLYSLIVGNSDIARLPAGEFRDMVLRRLRTVMDGYFSAPSVLENRFGALADLMDPPAIGTSDADRDRTKWGTWGNDGGLTVGGATMRYHIDQIRNVYLPGRRTFLNTATIAGTAVPASQPVNAADLVTIETVDFNPGTGTQDHEFFVLRNSNAYSVDISGWQITGAVTWTFKPGTVLPPGGGATENLGDLYVAKDPYLFRQRPSVPDDGLAGANQYRFVQGPYGGQLSARGETIELRSATGTLLKTKAWTPAPTALQVSLRITELNYAPVPPSPAEAAALPGVVESDFEFIELMNIGGSTLTLTGAHFDQGVTFTFPAFTLNAGARCLLVANVAAFQLRYGHAFDAQIAGAYTGNLDNNGEAIQLLDNVGENILDFIYNNSWFPPSDEGGRTIVIRNANPDWAAYGFPTSWALSGEANGSPGTGDADFANVYEGWRLDHFTTLELPTLVNPNAPAAVTVDADGDFLINLAEYAFGRNPRVADHRGLATGSVVDVSGTKYDAITFTRRHKALDLTYAVEATGDFTTWTPVDLPVGTPVDLGNGIEQVTYRDSTPAGVTKRYLRVRAVK